MPGTLRGLSRWAFPSDFITAARAEIPRFGLLDYMEVARSAVLLSAEHGRHVGDGVWCPDGRPLNPCGRS